MVAETLALGGFLAGLAICVITGQEILYALLFGMICFSAYALYRGVMPANVLRMLAEGMGKVAMIIFLFVLIGCLTALWRASGTIPFILYYSSGLIQPRYFVLCAFLLCCMMSFLTGTSFGTVSTMGVICMMISNALGLSPALTGGAVLSGIYFGDRCSPMSSSALLVSSLTKTDIYTNVRNMMRTSLVPFVVTCLVYVALTGNVGQASPELSMLNMFEEQFALHWITVIPAVLILVLALLRVNVKYAMTASILLAAVIALVVQKVSLSELPALLWQGYRAGEGTKLAEMLNGGGIQSMAKVAGIVLISSSYSGIFAHTRLLSGVRRLLRNSVPVLRPFGTVMLTAILTCAVSCNQSLPVILTSQICDGIYEKKEDLALAIENTVIVIAALIPWGIAGTVPMATMGAPLTCLLFACYIYLIPLWNLLKDVFFVPNR
ncbi:MAG: Na+/H+ antiporter NhaC family protein [Eubacteriales bacterium]|nr:Na+/H+ antiporter NhaC family protein [Eubacteriales bacterium]